MADPISINIKETVALIDCFQNDLDFLVVEMNSSLGDPFNIATCLHFSHVPIPQRF